MVEEWIIVAKRRIEQCSLIAGCDCGHDEYLAQVDQIQRIENITRIDGLVLEFVELK